MEWAKSISEAIEYIENNITKDISAEKIAAHVNISPFYFQRGFALLCGFTISEYIRNRRLALAAGELAVSGTKVIDVAIKYGYDSPDAFTKAFTRFHGVTPSMVQKNHVTMKTFAPLKIKLSLEGGYMLDYKLVKKESFKIMGLSKMFPYDGAKEVIPRFWEEYYAKGNGKYVCGMFGINIDESMMDPKQNEFEYIIADPYNPAKELPEGFVTRTIPEFTWAVFPCKGPVAETLQDTNTKIFSEWLPALREYEFAAGYCVEMYEDAGKYPKGTADENYYCEIWIPVKRK